MTHTGLTASIAAEDVNRTAEAGAEERLPMTQALMVIGSASACLWILIALSVNWLMS